MNFMPLYEIVQEDHYVQELEEICKNYHRMEDLDNAITWALARNPRLPGAVKIANPDGYVLKINANFNKNLPAVDVIYEIDDASEQVILLDIWEVQ